MNLSVAWAKSFEKLRLGAQNAAAASLLSWKIYENFFQFFFQKWLVFFGGAFLVIWRNRRESFG